MKIKALFGKHFCVCTIQFPRITVHFADYPYTWCRLFTPFSNFGLVVQIRNYPQTKLAQFPFFTVDRSLHESRISIG